MRPSVHGDVILELVERGPKQLWILQNVFPDEKMRRFDFMLLEEPVKLSRTLKSSVNSCKNMSYAKVKVFIYSRARSDRASRLGK